MQCSHWRVAQEKSIRQDAVAAHKVLSSNSDWVIYS
jgi:hypothetical protein